MCVETQHLLHVALGQDALCQAEAVSSLTEPLPGARCQSHGVVAGHGPILGRSATS